VDSRAPRSDKLLNQRKRTFPRSATPVVLSLDDLETLQQAADRLFGLSHARGEKVKELTAEERDQLRNLRVGSGDISEGDFVQVSGFMVGLPQRRKAEGAESVNCSLADDGTHKNSDFHIPLARNAADTEYKGVVVEMIPQRRPAVWRIEARPVRAGARDRRNRAERTMLPPTALALEDACEEIAAWFVRTPS